MIGFKETMRQVSHALDGRESILITGPVASGKSTLLEDIRQELDRRGVRIKFHDCLVQDTFTLDPDECRYFLLDHAPRACRPFQVPTVLATRDARQVLESPDLMGWDLVIILDRFKAAIIKRDRKAAS